MRLYNQDNRETLKELPDNSVDSVVTDPPYGLSFMNKKWDYDVPSIEFWKEVYRVLKPGGHILSFGGTRTYHRMVVNIEDAGFEIRDQIQWIYGSGFPKSLNIGKAVDKIEGNEREVVGKVKRHDFKDPQYIKQGSMMMTDNSLMLDLPITKGSSEYEGFGTALKPSNEPIVLARKPLSEKSIAENVMRWRTGGLNIDGCRIGFNEDDSYTKLKGGVVEGKEAGQMYHRHEKGMEGNNYKQKIMVKNDTGRFPANVILECICNEVIQGESHFKMRNKLNGEDICKDATSYKIGAGVPNYDYNDKGDIHTNPDCPCYIMDEQSGVSKSTKMRTGDRDGFLNSNDVFGIKNDGKTKRIENFGDGGGASRFFYRPKVSKKERNLGLDDKSNNHPTLKPINLLTYLCRLITPPNGVVLDPFMGSGSTGVAALLEGFDFIGMELEKDYYEIAKKRIENYELYKKIIK